MIVLGMMSGTSGDGIDAAIVEFSGQAPALHWKLVKHVYITFPAEIQAEIFTCFNPATSGVDRLCALNFALGKVYGEAALQAIAESGLRPEEIDLIGNHGQSVWHMPTGPKASTLQIGEAAFIAEMTGITTISNFRSRDMAAGGQGAPLVSFMDVLLFSHPQIKRAMQNIGGIANATYLPNEDQIARGIRALAFDTGPGNMLIDDAIRRITGGQQQYDAGGHLAAQGQVNQELLEGWIAAEIYLRLPAPKTTGRELFGEQYGACLWAEAQKRRVKEADYTATITAFIARTIADGYRSLMPAMPDEVIVSGGGAYNPTLLKMLADQIAPARIGVIDDFGMPSDAKEAVAFALMAYETWHNRPGNLPSATEAHKAVVLGSITPGNNLEKIK